MFQRSSWLRTKFPLITTLAGTDAFNHTVKCHIYIVTDRKNIFFFYPIWFKSQPLFNLAPERSEHKTVLELKNHRLLLFMHKE